MAELWRLEWSWSLLGGKTTSSGIIKSSLESSLGVSNILRVSNVAGGNLSSLGITVYWGKSSMFTSFSSSKGSAELSLGSSNISGVLNGEGGGSSQNRGDQQFVHFECLCPENLQSDSPC